MREKCDVSFDGQLKKKAIRRSLFFYLCVLVGFVAIAPIVFTSDWISSSDVHSTMEIWGSLIGLCAAISCLMYYFGSQSRFFLLIGLGFFIGSSEDMIHGILAWKRLFEGQDIDFSKFIPGTYVTGRLLLASFIFVAPLLESKMKPTKNPKKEAFFFSLISIILGITLTGIAFLLPLPKFMFPNHLISRPIDFISALLFIFAFLLIFRRFRAKGDVFSSFLLASLLFNICGQVYISFSKQLFDSYFDLAHGAKILGYAMPVLGIAIQSLTEMKITHQEMIVRKKAEKTLEVVNQDLEAMVEKLTLTNQELNDFVYVASHDLREPIRKISSFGALLQDSLADQLDEDNTENLEFMIDGASRMQQLIEDLLDYSRVTSREITFIPVNLNKIVEQLQELELANPLEESRGIISVPQELPTVLGDEGQIRQLMQNMISNGLKYHQPDVAPEITLRVEREDDTSVRIIVEDNGIGIKEEHYKDVFTMFRRLHSRGEYTGTGIGLAICKKIINRHNGKVGLDSTVGQGTRFWFTLSKPQESLTVEAGADI